MPLTPTPTAVQLASKDRVDHPNATEETCAIYRPHPPHPYGRIHESGGLSHWCEGA